MTPLNPITEIYIGMVLHKKKPFKRKLGIGNRLFYTFLVAKRRERVQGAYHIIDFLVVPFENEIGFEVSNENFCLWLSEEEINNQYKITKILK